MVRLVALIGFALFVVPAGAFAADDEEDERTGVYRSIGAIVAWNARDDGQDREDATGGLEAAIGFQLEKYGMGLFASWLEDETQISFGVEGKLFPMGFFSSSSSVFGSSGFVKPYLSAGVGLTNAEYRFEEGSSTAKNGHRWGGLLRVGMGVDVFVTSRLAVTATAEYRPGTGGLHHIDNVVGGVGLKLIGF